MDNIIGHSITKVPASASCERCNHVKSCRYIVYEQGEDYSDNVGTYSTLLKAQHYILNVLGSKIVGGCR